MLFVEGFQKLNSYVLLKTNRVQVNRSTLDGFSKESLNQISYSGEYAAVFYEIMNFYFFRMNVWIAENETYAFAFFDFFISRTKFWLLIMNTFSSEFIQNLVKNDCLILNILKPLLKNKVTNNARLNIICQVVF